MANQDKDAVGYQKFDTKMTLDEVAKELGITNGYVSHLERSGLKKLRKLFEARGITSAEDFNLEDL